MSSSAATTTSLQNHASAFEVGFDDAPWVGGRSRPFQVRGSQSAALTTAIDTALASNANLAAHRIVSPVVTLPDAPRMDTAIVLQKWEGRVENIDNEGFTATLTDLTGSGPAEQAHFPWSEVSKPDEPLVVRGAIFYWSVGYRDAVSGQRTHESVLRFRRLPRWNSTDRREASSLVSSWRQALGWGD